MAKKYAASIPYGNSFLIVGDGKEILKYEPNEEAWTVMEARVEGKGGGRLPTATGVSEEFTNKCCK